MGPLPLTSAMVALAPMLTARLQVRRRQWSCIARRIEICEKHLPVRHPVSSAKFMRQIPDFFHDLIPRFDAILFQAGDPSSKAPHFFGIYDRNFKRWWWFPQFSLMFSKASQSSLGILRVPQLPPPLEQPPLKNPANLCWFFFRGN